MTAYRVLVTDHKLAALAGCAGEGYSSPPHPELEAAALARLLLGITELPNARGPWRQAIPGGQRTVWLEPEEPE
jgi:hypothetical protein